MSKHVVPPEGPLDANAPSGRPIRRRTRASTSDAPVSRRRRGGPSLKIIKWRDIPAQVNATSGDDKVQIELPHRFQAAIDRAAMLADKKDSNSYIAEMGQEVRPLEGDDLRAAVEACVASIESEFTMERLNDFVRNGGFAPGTSIGPADDGGTDPASSLPTPDSPTEETP